jgi:hypothetical protein
MAAFLSNQLQYCLQFSAVLTTIAARVNTYWGSPFLPIVKRILIHT